MSPIRASARPRDRRSRREAHPACELVAESGKLVAMDVVEVNPILDEHNRTALLVVELVLSALGKRVWKESGNG